MLKNILRKIKRKLNRLSFLLYILKISMKGGRDMWFTAYEYIALKVFNGIISIESIPATQRPFVQDELDKMGIKA